MTALLILVIPLWHSAITLGHPEEFITTGLVLGAALAAVNGRATTAALLLGLGLASKQWAVLALPAIALAVPRDQVKKTVLVTVAVYAALVIPMAIGNPGRFGDTLTAPGTSSHGLVDATTIWFPFAADHDKRVFDGVKYVVLPQRTLPHALESAMHPLIVLLAAALSLWFWRRKYSTEPQDIFLLLALIFLLRCMLDPVTNAYYHAPFLVSLALYEAFAGHRVPVVTLIASAAFLPRFGIDADSLRKANLLYLVWSIPLCAWLGVTFFRRQPLRPKL
jgi:glycosyl transferase family 87